MSAAGANHMRVSYITKDSSIPSKVQYDKVSGKYNAVATGDSSHYTYFLYTSGKIHNVKIGPLESDTVYYYRCGGVGDEFSFKTALALLLVEFAIVGWLFYIIYTFCYLLVLLHHFLSSNRDAVYGHVFGA